MSALGRIVIILEPHTKVLRPGVVLALGATPSSPVQVSYLRPGTETGVVFAHMCANQAQAEKRYADAQAVQETVGWYVDQVDAVTSLFERTTALENETRELERRINMLSDAFSRR